jgi:subtilisin family serine protease
MDDNKNTSSLFFITNKNLVRCALLTVTFFTVACNKSSKTTESVFPENNKSEVKVCGGDSPKSKFIRNEFIVTWENGDISVETADNSDTFIKDFMTPKLEKIRHVEYNKTIHLLDTNPAINDSNFYSRSHRFEESSLNLNSYDGAGDSYDSASVNSATEEVADKGPEQINAPAVWSQGQYGKDVLVAVVDSPVDITHPQLADRIQINEAEANGKSGVDDDGNGFVDDVYGWDFVHDTPQYSNNVSDHGTHVAGIIAANTTRTTVRGVAPQAKILAVNFLNADGEGSLFAAITALKYAASRGAKVINASWGASCYSASLEQEMTALKDQGIIFVAAAGNEYLDFDTNPKSTWTFPAASNLENQITVGANNMLGYLMSFSNRSYSLVHLTAPGYAVTSTVPGGYAKESGTSMAAPFVTGAVALLLGAFPQATPAQIKQSILAGVEKHQGYISKTLTGGILNVNTSMSYLKNK